MKVNKIVILHVFQDGLIFKGMARAFDSMPNVENLYYYFSPDKNFKLKIIDDPRVIIINDLEEYINFFRSTQIDVILFYSLPSWFYYLFNFIDKSKIVVWWAWGYDIYYQQGKYPPLIPMEDMLKPLTQDFVSKKIDCHKKSVFLKIYNSLKIALGIPKRVINKFFGRNIIPNPRKTQEEILARVDFFCSPLEIEYDIMRELHPSFRAERMSTPHKLVEYVFHGPKKEPGNVLVNHSLTHSDNHLDVFEYLYPLKLSCGRKYILPVSYGIGGNYNGNPDILIKESHFNDSQTLWIRDIMSRKEYLKVINTVSHAVFGVMRQQALGNIFLCLRNGVKVYLFKDSIVYKELKKMGFICFTIEDDLTIESLSECLGETDAIRNYEIFIERRNDNLPEKCENSLYKAVMKKKDKNFK